VSLRVLSTLTVLDIWFSSPASTLLSLALAVFRLTPFPLFLQKVVHPLTDFGPFSETLVGAAYPLMLHRSTTQIASSSHEVLTPFSAQGYANRLFARFQPDTFPLQPFSGS